MSLIVEDGTQIPGANSYATVAQADARQTLLGDTVWPDVDSSEKEAFLIQATLYMTMRYRLLWAGYRVSVTQSLDWPRYQVLYVDGPGEYSPFDSFYPNNVVPAEIVNATIDVAVRISNGQDMLPDLGVPVLEETVGPITTKYAKGVRQTTLFQTVDSLLSVFLKNAGSPYMVSLTRG